MEHLQPIEIRGDDELNLRPEEVAWLEAAAKVDRKTSGEVLDLSKAWDSVAELEIMLDRLKELGLYGQGLLFRGIDGGRIREERCEQHVQCSNEAELLSLDHEDSVYKIAIRYTVPAIIVYDATTLEKNNVYCPGPKPYRLKEGVSPDQAIVAIFILPIDLQAEEIAEKMSTERLRQAHC